VAMNDWLIHARTGITHHTYQQHTDTHTQTHTHAPPQGLKRCVYICVCAWLWNRCTLFTLPLAYVLKNIYTHTHPHTHTHTHTPTATAKQTPTTNKTISKKATLTPIPVSTTHGTPSPSSSTAPV
jgi:hypothetical protein